jgi:hypothetical protein
MVEGCEKCLRPERWTNPKMKTCKGCGAIRRQDGLMGLVGLECSVCREPSSDKKRVMWTSKLHWTDDGEMVEQNVPICVDEECIRELHRQVEQRFNETHEYPMEHYSALRKKGKSDARR